MTLIHNEPVVMKKYYANVLVGDTPASSTSEDWCVRAASETHAREKIAAIALRWNKWVRVIFVLVEN